MLFPIPKKTVNLFDSISGLRLIEEFKKLDDKSHSDNDKRMRFVMLVADYQSPLKQHPESKRRELAALEAGWVVQTNARRTIDARGKLVVDGKDKDVEAAITKYRELQINEDRELLELYTKQINDIKKAISTSTDDPDVLKKRNTLLESLPALKESKNKLAKMTDLEDLEIDDQTEDNRPLSLIDKLDD